MILFPLLLLASAADQKTSDKLPPANPLPMPVSEESQVMVPLNAWFAAIDAADANAIRAQLRMDGGGGETQHMAAGGLQRAGAQRAGRAELVQRVGA